jgi:hypothetical protein
MLGRSPPTTGEHNHENNPKRINQTRETIIENTFLV